MRTGQVVHVKLNGSLIARVPGLSLTWLTYPGYFFNSISQHILQSWDRTKVSPDVFFPAKLDQILICMCVRSGAHQSSELICPTFYFVLANIYEGGRLNGRRGEIVDHLDDTLKAENSWVSQVQQRLTVL